MNNHNESTNRPNGQRWWLAVGVAAVAAVCLCVAAAVYAATLFRQRTTTAPPPSPPDLATATATSALDGNETAGPTPTLAVPTTPPSTVTSTPAVSGPLTIQRMATPPTLDGNPTEWSGMSTVTTPFITGQSPGWDGALDVESTWRLGWDDTYLYGSVTVVDEVHVQNEQPQFAYYGDSLELQFDTDLEGDYGPQVNRDDYQYVISPGDFASLPAGVFRFRGDEAGEMIDAPGTRAQAVAAKATNGYIIEFAIPWIDMNSAAEPGLAMGVVLSVNDNDTPGLRQQVLMLSHVATRQWLDPTTWGMMTLE